MFAPSVETGAGSVMYSYNLVNVTYACVKDYNLNILLKEEIELKGFV